MLYSIFWFMYLLVAVLTGAYIVLQTIIQLMVCSAYNETCHLRYALGYYHWFCKYFSVSLSMCTIEEAIPILLIVMPLSAALWPIAIPLFVINKLRMYSTLPKVIVSMIKALFKPCKET